MKPVTALVLAALLSLGATAANAEDLATFYSKMGGC